MNALHFGTIWTDDIKNLQPFVIRPLIGDFNDRYLVPVNVNMDGDTLTLKTDPEEEDEVSTLDEGDGGYPVI